MWNDTDTPRGYLITFRCFGTWIHGDERGSIDRHNNFYGSPKYPKIEHWENISAKRMKRKPVLLDSARRKSVEQAIRETCRKRGWGFVGINVRTNHVHVVVCIGALKPSAALNAFKANATRQMRQDGCWTSDRSPWADKGSERYLWTEKNIQDAVEYVVNGQGVDL